MKVLDLEGLGYFWTKIKNKFYIKPDTGIPKSDLSSEVQGSLNKADTALQTETDPIFTASPAHGISSEDIVRWNNLESLGISTLSLSIDSSTYVLTLSGTKIDGTSFVVPNPIDLPLESVVISGSYDSVNKKVILTLKDGSTIDFSIADLVSGLQTEITSTNKLSADLISDGTTNKVYTATEKTKLAGIASGAEVNVQSDWNETNSSSDAYILNKPHIPDITGKADKVTGAVSGNFAALDSNGNLVDSGYSYTDCLNELSDQYAPATESSELEPGDTFEEAFGKLEKTVTDNEYITAQALNDLNTNKQDTLESGTNIKTINGESILGSGDFNVTGDCIAYPSFEIDSNGHLIMSGGQQGLFTLENGHLMYNF